MKQLASLLLLPFLIDCAYANQKAQGYCEQGGHVVVTSGLNSTTQVQQSYPQCTVTVYLTGTTTIATIFSDNNNTPLSNPFTADSTGHWGWYAANGRYDVQLSGGGIGSPFTIADILLADPAGGGTTVSSITAGTGISVNQPTGAVTVTNSGVTSAAAGAGISVSGSTGGVTISNTWGAIPSGTQTQYLRLQPNAGNSTTNQFANLPVVNPQDYAYSPITPSSPASLTGGGGAQSITVSLCPLGIYSSAGGWTQVLISGGTGTAEVKTPSGGTCSSATLGVQGGTIIVSPSNNHSGAWTLSPASGGIAEALNSLASSGGTVDAPAGLYTFYGTATTPSTTRTHCESGAHFQMAAGFYGNFSSVGMIGTTAASYHDIVIDGCEIDGNEANNSGLTSTCHTSGLTGVCPMVFFGGGGSTASRVSVRDNYIHGNPGNTGTSGTTQAAFLATTGGSWEFRHNTLASDSGNFGGFLTTAPDTLIADNSLPGTWGDAGLVCNNNSFCRILGNHISHTGLNLEGSTFSLVEGNTVDVPCAVGVILQDIGEGNTVVGNSLYNVPTTCLGTNGIGIAYSRISAPSNPATLTIIGNTITLNGGLRYYNNQTSFPASWTFLDAAYGAGIGASTLSNGSNENIAVSSAFVGISGSQYLKIGGPSGAFSVGGFVAGNPGSLLYLLNATGQTMTINHLDGGSSAANRIYSGTQGNLTNVHGAVLLYDSSASLWVVVSYY